MIGFEMGIHRIALRGVFVFLLMLVGPHVAVGQIYYYLSLGPDEDVEGQVKRIVDSESAAATARLNAKVLELALACELSEAQVRKLKVAVKGSVSSHIKGRAKEIQNQADRFGVQVVRFPIAKKWARDIDGSEFWKRAISKTLTDTQQEKMAAWDQQRAAFQRASAVQDFIAELDRALFLQAEQREKLTEVIDEHFGEALLKRKLNPRRASNTIPVPEPPEPKYLSLVEDILDKAQQDVWKWSTDPLLQTIK